MKQAALKIFLIGMIASLSMTSANARWNRSGLLVSPTGIRINDLPYNSNLPPDSIEKRYWDMHDGGDFPGAFGVAVDIILKYPEVIEGARLLRRLMGEDYRIRKDVATLLAQGGALRNSPLAPFLRETLRLPDLRDEDELALLREWLIDHPNDPIALRASAGLWTIFEHFRKASEELERALLLPCYYTDNIYKELIKSYIQRGLYDSAQKRTIEIGKVLGISDGKSRYVLAEAMMDAGELGKARDLLDAMHYAGTLEDSILILKIRLEISSKRPDAALGLFNQLGEAVDTADYYHRKELMLQTLLLAKDDYPKADSVMHTIEWLRAPPTSIFFYASNVLYAEDKEDDRLRFWKQATDRFPHELWMQQNLAGALYSTNPQVAVRQGTNVLSINPFDDWMLGRLRVWLTAIDTQMLHHTFDSLTEALPFSHQVWTAYAQTLDESKQESLWLRAMELNPHSFWPRDELIDLLKQRERWQDAIQLVDSSASALKEGGCSDRGDLLFARAAIILDESKKESIDSGRISAAFHDLDLYRDSNGYLGAYHKYRSWLFAAEGQYDSCVLEMERTVQLRPDNRDYISNFLTDGRLVEAIGKPRICALYYANFLRNPYDGNRISSLAERHARWAGSSVVALELYSLLRARDPDEYVATSWLRAQTSANFGENELSFQTMYRSARATVGESDRYTDWYNAARLNAQKLSSSKIEWLMDTTRILNDTMRVVHPDGLIEYRAVNPVFGEPTYLRVGSAWASAEYDSVTGDLVKTTTSNGGSLLLKYQSAGLISEIVDEQGRKVRFEYNHQRKPVVISVDGIGRLEVVYMANGIDIDSTYSDGGPKTSLEITSIFQKLLTSVKYFQEGNAEALLELERPDLRQQKLEEALDEAKAKYELRTIAKTRYTAKLLALADFLFANVHARQGNAREAKELLDGYVDDQLQDSQHKTIDLHAAREWYQLEMNLSPMGLNAEDWSLWTRLYKAISSSPIKGQTSALLDTFDHFPLELAQQERWLSRSMISNPGYWHQYRLADVFGDVNSGNLPTKYHSELIRRSGDVLIGTERGLAVLHDGYWRVYMIDEEHLKFTSEEEYTHRASSEILSLEEDSSGVLWLGTGNGLFRLAGDYSGARLTKISLQEAGLESPDVQHLQFVGQTLYCGSSMGLAKIEHDNPVEIQKFRNVEIKSMTLGIWNAGPVSDQKSIRMIERLIVSTQAGTYILNDTNCTKLCPEYGDQMAWDPETQNLLLFNGTQVLTGTIDSDPKIVSMRRLQGQANVNRTSLIYKILELPSEVGDVTAILTDQGLTLCRDGRFDLLITPPSASDAAAYQAAWKGEKMCVVKSDGVFVFEKPQISVFHTPVHDLLYSGKDSLTWVAAENGLFAMASTDSGAEPLKAANISATHIALDRNGKLLADDGSSIVIIDSLGSEPRTLFSLEQTLDSGWSAGSLTSILPSSDGSVWASAGASVFRYSDGVVQEFSIFKNMVEFPSRSELISQVIETKDHHIWVIASDEAHLTYRNISLSGGVLEWTGHDFKRLKLPDETNYWFIHSYTPIDSSTAIVGTNRGFVRHDHFGYTPLAGSDDSSYSRMLQDHPSLFLGTRGARLDSLTWLFGCAAGVVGIHDGEWFYPERLNYMLPEQYLREYGSNHTNAIAIDPKGVIYVGTDRGLLCYRTEKNDAVPFLISNQLAPMAFADYDRRQAKNLFESYAQSLDSGSAMARKLKVYRASSQQLEILKENAASRNTYRLASEVDSSGTTEESNKLIEEIRLKDASNKHMLLDIQSDKFISQGVKFNPLDLSSVSRNIPPTDVFVQYLPTLGRLLIQVVSREGAVLREVDVPKDSLFEFDSSAVELLREQPEKATASLRTYELRTRLHWLYQKLIEPIVPLLRNKTHVYIVPCGKLAYLPFGALISSTDQKVEYVAEKYNIGYMPTMYLMDLMLRKERCSSGCALIMAPTKDLSGAKEEAKMVQSTLTCPSELKLEEQASFAVLSNMSDSVRIIHFATHSIVDASPSESFLVLADRKLTNSDICSMHFPKANIAVLSACQSAKGSNGLEYESLAMGFAAAEVPTVVGTLWNISDAATPDLIKAFYEEYRENNDAILSMADAQRKLLRVNGSDYDPSLWASFIVMGRP